MIVCNAAFLLSPSFLLVEPTLVECARISTAGQPFTLTGVTACTIVGGPVRVRLMRFTANSCTCLDVTMHEPYDLPTAAGSTMRSSW
jgi:hypothetical protein